MVNHRLAIGCTNPSQNSTDESGLIVANCAQRSAENDQNRAPFSLNNVKLSGRRKLLGVDYSRPDRRTLPAENCQDFTLLSGRVSAPSFPQSQKDLSPATPTSASRLQRSEPRRRRSESNERPARHNPTTAIPGRDQSRPALGPQEGCSQRGAPLVRTTSLSRQRQASVERRLSTTDRPRASMPQPQRLNRGTTPTGSPKRPRSRRTEHISPKRSLSASRLSGTRPKSRTAPLTSHSYMSIPKLPLSKNELSKDDEVYHTCREQETSPLRYMDKQSMLLCAENQLKISLDDASFLRSITKKTDVRAALVELRPSNDWAELSTMIDNLQCGIQQMDSRPQRMPGKLNPHQSQNVIGALTASCGSGRSQPARKACVTTALFFMHVLPLDLFDFVGAGGQELFATLLKRSQSGVNPDFVSAAAKIALMSWVLNYSKQNSLVVVANSVQAQVGAEREERLLIIATVMMIRFPRSIARLWPRTKSVVTLVVRASRSPHKQVRSRGVQAYAALLEGLPSSAHEERKTVTEIQQMLTAVPPQKWSTKLRFNNISEALSVHFGKRESC